MPEYLSPGVYIEEIEIGAKPIEGVSTSTAGFVGMTEMGPIDKPTLVINFGEYQRIFGGYLGEKDEKDIKYNNEDEKFNLRLLPYSVEGFFANGGQRLYVTRVADLREKIKGADGSETLNSNKAKKSTCFLPNISGPAPYLLENVKSGAITLKLSNIANLAGDDNKFLLLKDGPLSEYLTFIGFAKTLTLRAPLCNSYTTTDDIFKLKTTETPFVVDENVAAGETKIKLASVAGLSIGHQLIINGPNSEMGIVVGSIDNATEKSITLKSPLLSNHLKGAIINAPIYKIAQNVAAGTTKILLDSVTGLSPDNPLIINDSDNSETSVVASVVDNAIEKSVTLKKPLINRHDKDKIINELTPIFPDIKANPKSIIKAGYTVIPIDEGDTNFNINDCIKINTEYFIIKNTDADKVILIADELKYQHNNDITNNKNIELKKLIPAVQIEASNEGTWGNNIKIVVKESSILSDAKLKKPALNQDFLELNTVTGIEIGTMLKLQVNKPIVSDPIYRIVTDVIKTDDTKRVMFKNNPITESLAVDQKVSTVEFDFLISFDGPGGKVEEVFKNLSLNEGHSRFVKKIITPEASGLIRIKTVIESADPGQKILLPTQDKEPGWKLKDGTNGIPLKVGDLIEIYKGIDDPEPLNRTGLQTLKNIDGISIVAMPGITEQTLQNQLIIHCETLKDRFAVLDSVVSADLVDIQAQRNLYDSKFAAIYYPWIRVFDSVSQKPINVPPSGYLCGIYARSDTERGVHKAPANEVVNGALDLEEISTAKGKRIITKGQQDILNPKGINCIRVFPGRGIRVWGARTISSDSLWKYINIRRLFIYIEGSIYKGTQWVVFEPNNEKLWGRVKATIDEFLTRVWRDGALMGLKAEEAFFIKCDRTTMTQADIDNGRLICVIGIAPVKPAEFVIFRIAQWAGGSASKE